MNPDKHELDTPDSQLEDLLNDALQPGQIPDGLADRIIQNTQAGLGQPRQGVIGRIAPVWKLRIAAVIALSCITAMWVVFATDRRGDGVDEAEELAAVQSELDSLLASEQPLALEVDQATAVLSLQIDQYQWNGDWQGQLAWVDDILIQTDQQMMGPNGLASF